MALLGEKQGAACTASRVLFATAMVSLGLILAPIVSCEGTLWRRSPQALVYADAATPETKALAGARSVVVLPSGSSIADIAEKVTPSVVSVFSERSSGGADGRELQPFFSDPFFEFFFGRPGQAPMRKLPRDIEQSLGSGVIVAPDGLIMTNHHVVEDADKIRVALKDGRELKAKLIGADPKSDLAVLRVSEKNLPAIEVADSRKLRTGDLVLAVGSPFGLGQTVTMGIVSAVGRANMGITDYEDFVQTDAAINPGNSGGALVTMEGRLAGINTAIVSRSGGYQGIGFAIPSRMAIQIKDAILRDGRVVRGWLGVAIQDLTQDLAKAVGAEPKAGVLISDVTPGGPAAAAGLRRGDVITLFDGVKPTDSSHLRRLVADAGKDKKVTLSVLRDGKQRSFEVELGEQPSEQEPVAGPARHDQGLGVLDGVELRELDAAARRSLDLPADVSGVLVGEVEPGSPAASAGLRPGDVILEANRAPTANLKALRAALKRDDDKALLLVQRRGGSFYMLLSK